MNNNHTQQTADSRQLLPKSGVGGCELVAANCTRESFRGFTTQRAERTTHVLIRGSEASVGSKTVRGFTLLEMVVSVGIFAIVMLVATSAFLSLISLDRKARTTNDVVTNLSFAMDAIARSIRTGSQYQCGGLGGNNCWPAGQDSFAFLDSSGCDETFALVGGQVVQTIQSGTATCTYSPNVPLTDPRVTIPSGGLMFYVRGVGSGTVDDAQPRVTISLHGTMTPDSKSPPVDFTIQTSAEQRLLDL